MIQVEKVMVKIIPCKRELRARRRGILTAFSSGSKPSVASKLSRKEIKPSQLASACQGKAILLSINPAGCQ